MSLVVEVELDIVRLRLSYNIYAYYLTLIVSLRKLNYSYRYIV